MSTRHRIWSLASPVIPERTVGSKFFSLWQLARRGLPVPQALSVPADMVGDERSSPQIQGACRRLGAHSLAVRSSSPDEDRVTSSRAGWYRSLLNVSPDRVCEAIRECGCLPDGQAIPVTVQAMVDARVAGVMFTQHPQISAVGSMLIEAAVGTGDRLLSGEEPEVAAYSWTRDGGWNPEGGPLSATDLGRLEELAVAVEQVQGCGRDLEWAIDREDRLWLLQSRPITRLPDEVRFLAGGRVLVGPYCVPGTGSDPEKVVVRDLVLDLGHPAIDHQRVWLFRVPRGSMIPRSELADLFTTDFVEVGRDILPLSRLSRTLAEWSGDTPVVTVRVKDFPVADVAGVSSALPSGGVLIEYAAGAGLGIARGLTSASGLVVGPGGDIVSHWRVPQADRYSFDRRRRKLVVLPFRQEPILRPELVAPIVVLTRAVAAREPEARAEWWVTGDRVLFVDYFAETAALSEPDTHGDDVRWMSSGHLQGRLHWLHDIDVLRTRCERLGMEAALASAGSDPELKSLVTDGRDEPIIIGAPVPAVALYALAPLVAGFVFPAGSLLCHLGSLLREARIPAAISPRLADPTRDGDWLDLKPERPR